MKKLLKWGLIAVGVLVVLIVVFWLFFLNGAIRIGVEKGGMYATDRTTTLNAANLSIRNGTLDLSSLSMDNPKGYSMPVFLNLKECKVTVQPSSLLAGTVNVPEISMDGLEITLEQNGLKNNLAEILDVIQRKTSAGNTTGNTQGASSPGKKLQIGVIRMTGTKVHIKAVTEMTLDLGPIEIKDPSNPDGRPMKIADVIGKVLISVAKQIADNPQVPGGLKDGLGSVNKLFGDSGKQLQGGLNDATKGLQDMFKKH